MAETGLILGHSKPSVLKDHNHTKHLDVGLQSLFNKRPERRGRLQPLVGLRAMRFPGAPSDLRGTDLHQEMRHHPDVLTASTKGKRSAVLRRLREARAKKLREEWIKSEKEGYLERGCVDQGQKYTNANMTPERARVCNLMFISDQVQSSQQWRLNLFQSLRDLSSCEPRNFLCPVTSCARHTKPLADKRCLLAHSARHKRDDDPTNHIQYFCPLIDCPRKGKPFASRRNFLRHSNTHEES